MNRFASAFAFLSFCSILSTNQCVSAGELFVEDRTGRRIGRIVTTPDGQVLLQDKIGKRVGRLRPSAQGSFLVQDNSGQRRATVRPR